MTITPTILCRRKETADLRCLRSFVRSGGNISLFRTIVAMYFLHLEIRYENNNNTSWRHMLFPGHTHLGSSVNELDTRSLYRVLRLKSTPRSLLPILGNPPCENVGKWPPYGHRLNLNRHIFSRQIKTPSLNCTVRNIRNCQRSAPPPRMVRIVAPACPDRPNVYSVGG